MKILFLDIDGVMNTERYLRIQVENNNGVPFSNMDYNFDPEALANLKQIVEDTGAFIIISSTWRVSEALYEEWDKDDRPKVSGNLCHWDSLVDNLNSVGVGDKIVGVTPYLHHPDDPITGERIWSSVHRGREINKWLEDNKELGIESFVIIDDDADMDEYVETNLAQCKAYYGLTDEVRDKAIKILGGH